jgi:hypothetical protein
MFNSLDARTILAVCMSYISIISILQRFEHAVENLFIISTFPFLSAKIHALPIAETIEKCYRTGDVSRLMKLFCPTMFMLFFFSLIQNCRTFGISTTKNAFEELSVFAISCLHFTLIGKLVSFLTHRRTM